MPTPVRRMIAWPDGRLAARADGRIKMAIACTPPCRACYYTYIWSWACATNAWTRSRTSYCGDCPPSWATAYETLIDLSSGSQTSYGWVKWGASCLCTGSCATWPDPEPSAPVTTPLRIKWSAWWNCTSSTWTVACISATAEALSGWSAGDCYKTCVVSYRTTPSAPVDTPPASCCEKGGGGEGAPPPDPCSAIYYQWSYAVCTATITGPTMVCTLPHDWSGGCAMSKVTIDNVQPAAPANPTACTSVTVWYTTCLEADSNSTFCVPTSQTQPGPNGEPPIYDLDGDWVFDVTNCRWYRYTDGTPPPDAPPCPGYYDCYEAVFPSSIPWVCPVVGNPEAPGEWTVTKVGRSATNTYPDWTDTACMKKRKCVPAGDPPPASPAKPRWMELYYPTFYREYTLSCSNTGTWTWSTSVSRACYVGPSASQVYCYSAVVSEPVWRLNSDCTYKATVSITSEDMCETSCDWISWGTGPTEPPLASSYYANIVAGSYISGSDTVEYQSFSVTLGPTPDCLTYGGSAYVLMRVNGGVWETMSADVRLICGTGGSGAWLLIINGYPVGDHTGPFPDGGYSDGSVVS